MSYEAASCAIRTTRPDAVREKCIEGVEAARFVHDLVFAAGVPEQHAGRGRWKKGCSSSGRWKSEKKMSQS